MSNLTMDDKEALDQDSDSWVLRLYVAGRTVNSIRAIENLEKIASSSLDGKFKIEVIDLLKNPTLAKGDQIVAVPTLVRKLPPPLKRLIGDLSDTEKVLVGLDLKPAT